jgi:hypothetical protein
MSGLPATSTNGFPGKRDEAKRAGITTVTDGRFVRLFSDAFTQASGIAR